MGEVGKCVNDTADHPYIYFEADLILQVRVNNLRRSVHRGSHSLYLFLDVVILRLADIFEIDEAIGARSKIAQFEGPIGSN
jgi:hypothetical protein